MKAAQPVHAHLAHVMRFLQSKREEIKHSHFLHLLWYKHREFVKGFTDLAYFDNYIGALFAVLPDSINPCKLAGCQLHHVCQAFNEYMRRIGNNLQKYPNRFWLLARDPPDECSKVREELCAEILSLDPEDLTPTIAKLVEDWRPELEQAARDGKLDHTLHCMLIDVGAEIVIATDDVEGANNMLRTHALRCSHSSLATTSDRLRIRRKILSGQTVTKWSSVRPFVESLKRECLEALERADKVLGDLHRWSTPEPVSLNTGSAKKKPTAFGLWQAPKNSALFHSVKPDAFQSAITISIPAGPAQEQIVLACLLTKYIPICENKIRI